MGAEKKKKNIKAPLYTWFPAVAIAAVIALMPVIVGSVEIILHECELPLAPNGGGILIDHCQRTREIFVFAAGCILLLYWAGERIFPDHPLPSPLVHEKAARLPMISCGGLLLMSVISAVFSQHGEVSFWGFATQSEGIAALIGYILLYLAAYCWLRGDRLRLISFGALAAAGIMTVFYLTERISGQQMTQLVWGIADERTGTALLFGNSAVCGEFSVLLFPVLLLSGLRAENPTLRAVFSLAAGVMACITVTSYSTAAFAGLGIAAVLCAALILFTSCRNRRALYSLLALAPFAVMLAVNFSGTLRSLQISAENAGVYAPGECFRLTDIDISGDTLTLYSGDDTLTVKLTEDGAEASGNGEYLCALGEKMAPFPGEFSSASARLSGGLLQFDLGYDDTIEFQALDGEIIYIGLNGYLDPEPSTSAFPELSRFYSFGTGRGYIWLNSLPILKNCILKGVGEGQFAFWFPQDDIVGMLNTHGTTALLTDKPHCMYLGIALSDGIPALALFACLVFIAVKRGFFPALRDPVRAGVIISLVCFLVMGIVNDSAAAYSSLFWIFAGVCSQPDAPSEDPGK